MMDEPEVDELPILRPRYYPVDVDLVNEQYRRLGPLNGITGNPRFTHDELEEDLAFDRTWWRDGVSTLGEPMQDQLSRWEWEGGMA